MHSPRFLFACLLTSLTSFWGTPAIAQVIPDQTLGNESSIVTPNVEVNGNIADTIDGGAIRGSNLFHSFSEFSIGKGESLYFSSPVNIEHIFSRVTGGNITTIEGLLGTTGASDAALILINPNGLVFGKNASLDAQGSFTATTAAGVELGEAGRFSATNPNSDNLLSIQPSAFFFENLDSRPTIEVATQGQRSFFLDLLNERLGGLSVPNEESISLIGGNVLLENATINARGGQVVLGSVIGERTVDLTAQGVSFSNSGERGDIRIDDSSYINVKGNPSGGMLLFADNVDILSGSSLLAGSGYDAVESLGGDLAISANGAVTISNSTLENALNVFSTGVSGDIRIESRELSLEGGGVLKTGIGNGAEGSSGNIILEVGTLSLNNRSVVEADTFGRGDAGDIFIRSGGAIALDGMSRISSSNAVDAVGDGGEIDIRASNVAVRG
jgi:filamentous hemagglutinin family protein